MSKLVWGMGDAPVTGAWMPITISSSVTPAVSSSPGSYGPTAAGSVVATAAALVSVTGSLEPVVAAGVVDSPASVLGGWVAAAAVSAGAGRACLGTGVRRVGPCDARLLTARGSQPEGKQQWNEATAGGDRSWRECVMLRPSARCCRRGSGSRPATRFATVADHRAVRRSRRSRRRAPTRAG